MLNIQLSILITAVTVAIVASSLVLGHDVVDNIEEQWGHFNNANDALRHFHEHKNPAAQRQHRELYNTIARHEPHFDRIRERGGGAGVGKMSCTECETLVATLQAMTKTKQSQNQTATLIDDLVCSKQKTSIDKDICKAVVKLLVFDLLPAVFKGVTSLAWNIPKTICADLVKVCTMPCCNADNTPEQIFLSFANQTEYTNQIRVTWTTLTATPGASVSFGTSGSTVNVASEILPTRTYTFGGWIGVIHTAVMSGLQPNTQYWYQISSGGSNGPTSANITFRTLSMDAGRSASNPLRFAQVADMGYGPNSDPTIAAITKLVDNGTVHALLFPGDFGYSDGDASHFDDFQNKIQPIVSRVPLVSVDGNHELWANFTPYRTRISASMARRPEDAAINAMYFHQIIGSTHWLALDSETCIDTPNIDVRQVGVMKQFVADYPKSANLPWLLAMHHRPLYCTGGGKIQCGLFSDILRFQVENTLYNDPNNMVDFVLSGHIHATEVSWPVKNGVVVQQNYTQCKAPVYAVIAGAGNREGNGGGSSGNPSWRRTGFNEVSFGLHTVTGDKYNVQVLRSTDLAVLDTFTIQH